MNNQFAFCQRDMSHYLYTILSTKPISFNLFTHIYVWQDERQSQFLYERIQKTNSWRSEGEKFGTVLPTKQIGAQNDAKMDSKVWTNCISVWIRGRQKAKYRQRAPNCQCWFGKRSLKNTEYGHEIMKRINEENWFWKWNWYWYDWCAWGWWNCNWWCLIQFLYTLFSPK